MDDDIYTLNLKRRNSDPPVLDYDGRVVQLRPGLTLRLAAWMETTDIPVCHYSRCEVEKSDYMLLMFVVS